MKLYNKKQSFGMFNIPKGVLMLSIVLGHSITQVFPIWDYSYQGNILSFFVKLLTGMVIFGAMPAFFMFCGFGIRKRNVKECLKQQVKSCFGPYCWVAGIVSVVAVLKKILLNRSVYDAFLYTIRPFLLGYCAGQREWMGTPINTVGPLWFFVTFFFSVIFVNLILQRESMVEQISYVIILGIIGIVLKDEMLPFCFQQSLICTGYIYAGYFIKKTKSIQKDFSPVYAAVVLLFVLCFSTTGFMEISQNAWRRGTTDWIVSYFAGVICVFLLFRLNGIPSKAAGFFSWIGANSLDICCIHTVFYLIIPWDQAAERIHNNWITFIVMFVFHTITSFGGCYLLNNWRKKEKNT